MFSKSIDISYKNVYIYFKTDTHIGFEINTKINMSLLSIERKVSVYEYRSRKKV